MSVQYHVAFSSEIMGAGVFAGGPFNCAFGNVWDALYKCMRTIAGEPDVERSISSTKKAYKHKLIDNPSNLKKSRVWLFHGINDLTVVRKVMDGVKAYYEAFIDERQIAYVKNSSCGHGVPTADFGVDCSEKAFPYINNCGYDGAQKVLEQIYGTLSPKSRASGEFITFDQAPYINGWTPFLVGMHKHGHIYVPNACKGGVSKCKLHIAFHGCKMSSDAIGIAYYKKAGYNEWAEANNIVVLYPQAAVNNINPKGCWDLWGYTGVNYPYKDGSQMKTVHNMMYKIMGKSTQDGKQSQKLIHDFL
eukprot:TRINITY_DN33309_c0_g1_i1.p1 TRINITY_DN33309_c0_g1~~TRINITY_DN33309_c0_g1_i1.p1  ORF type:complete len:341 (+),score=26.23 TRINITY_DN33309_c0_g1_i1:112-1023(+)